MLIMFSQCENVANVSQTRKRVNGEPEDGKHRAEGNDGHTCHKLRACSAIIDAGFSKQSPKNLELCWRETSPREFSVHSLEVGKKRAAQCVKSGPRLRAKATQTTKPWTSQRGGVYRKDSLTLRAKLKSKTRSGGGGADLTR
jgi:hypothetical protein